MNYYSLPCNFDGGVAVCQSYGMNTQLNCGRYNTQVIVYQAKLNAYQFQYSQGDSGRYSNITVVCDPTQTGSDFRWNATNAPGSFEYDIIGYSSFACNPAYNPTPSPSPAPANFTFHVRTDASGAAQSWYLASSQGAVLEQYGPQGPYTFPAIAKQIYSFAGLVQSGAYTWFSAADATQYFVPTNSSAGGEPRTGGNGAIAMSAFPVPPAVFNAYASMIKLGAQVAAGNRVIIDSPSTRPILEVHSKRRNEAAEH
jgi:hypothetical protein